MKTNTLRFKQYFSPAYIFMKVTFITVKTNICTDNCGYRSTDKQIKKQNKKECTCPFLYFQQKVKHLESRELVTST